MTPTNAAVSDVSVQAFFQSFHAILGIYLTNHCNAKCRHCCVDSGPMEKSVLTSLETVLGRIEEWASRGVIKGLHVSGGEPFLRRRDLKHIGDVAARLGLTFGINTNAYWAKTPEIAAAVLAAIPGVTQLLISTSNYHQEFVSLEAFSHAVRSALDKGILVHIGICGSEADQNLIQAELLSRLGGDVMRNIRIVANQVEAVGRAAGLPEAGWRAMSRELPGGRCELLNRPVVLENSNVFACCNTSVASVCADSPLVLGNLGDSSLDDIYRRADRDYLLQAIRAKGPKYLAKLLIDAGEGSKLQAFFPEGYICALCSDIMSKPALVATLRQIIAQDATLRTDIAIARAANLDELEMLIDCMPTHS